MEIHPHTVKGEDDIDLRLWECPSPNPDRAVLFVHGATYSSRSVFAPLGAEDYSWLSHVVDSGGTAFGLDIRGYGDSQPVVDLINSPILEKPPVRASSAASDVHHAVEKINRLCDTDVHIVCTSWGTMVCGYYLTNYDASSIRSITFHAPVFNPSRKLADSFDINPDDNYREITMEQAKQRWDKQIPHSEPASFRGGDADCDPIFQSFWTSLTTSNQGKTQEGRTNSIVAPNGALVDVIKATKGGRIYDPSNIDIPTLIVRGSRDRTSTRPDAISLYDELTISNGISDYIEIGNGTHFLHLETRRKSLFHIVHQFQKI